jgi:hypothetical protein
MGRAAAVQAVNIIGPMLAIARPNPNQKIELFINLPRLCGIQYQENPIMTKHFNLDKPVVLR